MDSIKCYAKKSTSINPFDLIDCSGQCGENECDSCSILEFNDHRYFIVYECSILSDPVNKALNDATNITKCGIITKSFPEDNNDISSLIERRINLAVEKFNQSWTEEQHKLDFNQSLTEIYPKVNITRAHFCNYDGCNDVNTEHQIFDLCGDCVRNKAMIILVLITTGTLMIL